MRTRIVRLSVAAALAAGVAGPAVQQANAWACIDEIGQALCFVVGTACRATPDQDVPKTNLNVREACTFY